MLTLKEAIQGSKIAKWCAGLEIQYGQLNVLIAEAQHAVGCLEFLKNGHHQFTQLISICGVDYPGRAKRFEVVYQLLSMKHNLRIRLKVNVGENEAIPTATNVFRCANWYEREIWDLYGVPFSGHPDLRRIMTDYNFEGHPLRKDFPLTGHVEVRYDTTQQRVVYEDVMLTQEFRNFDFQSPWDGPNLNGGVLPGDEKATQS